MRIGIFKGAKLGGVVGFTTALTYAVITLTIVELFLPFGEPSIIVIFDTGFFKSTFLVLIQACIVWLLPPTIIGSVTAAIFGFYFLKSKPTRKQFVTRCTSLCGLIALPIMCLTIVEIIFVTFFAGVYHPFISPVVDFSLLLIFPCIIYVFTGFIVSDHLYSILSKINDQTSVS